MKRHFPLFILAILSGIGSGFSQTVAQHASLVSPQVITDKKPSTEFSVELKSFNLQKNKEGVVLYWETVFEKDNNYFEIQRNENGQGYKTIALMFAKENAEKGAIYRFVDKSTPGEDANIVNYRLVQVNMKGKAIYLARQTLTKD
jgi:hypothetical protein